MTLRTVVRDGLIVINTHGAIPDGTPVEGVRTVRKQPKAKESNKKIRRAARPGTAKRTGLPGIGIWKDRCPPDMSSNDVVRQLRSSIRWTR